MAHKRSRRWEGDVEPVRRLIPGLVHQSRQPLQLHFLTHHEYIEDLQQLSSGAARAPQQISIQWKSLGITSREFLGSSTNWYWSLRAGMPKILTALEASRITFKPHYLIKAHST